jgi:protein-L-isoaspartate(D-aspartate) O-methyltransferase
VAQAADASRLRRGLVAILEERRCIVSERVRDAFLAVPRELFLPDIASREGVAAVYRDEAFVTRHDQRGRPTSSSSQPAIMALMLERLELEEGHRILEIGTGTGYNAALLATIVGRRGRVVSVDIQPELVSAARRALRAGGFRVRAAVADGHAGWPAAAPYDRIIVTASSSFVPRAWLEQLVDEGRLEVPLRPRPVGAQVIPTFRRRAGTLRSVAMLAGGFMPLRGEDELPDPPRLSASAFHSGRAEPLLDLSGPGVSSLSSAARRRLLALALSKPREARVVHASPWSLAVFLSLTLPRARLVEAVPPGIGVWGKDGRSLALIAVRHLERKVVEMRSYGEPEAQAMLQRALGRWSELGAPSEEQLGECLRAWVRFRAGRGVATFRWRPR